MSVNLKTKKLTHLTDVFLPNGLLLKHIKNKMRIFNFSVSKFATILFLLSVLVAFYIFYTTLYDGIEQRETKSQ